jgi:hypothetical protein
MEWDLLDLLDPDRAGPDRADPTPAAAPSMHDRPTAVELVESVREYLERDVMPGEGRVAFHARVASRVLAMVERELTLGGLQYGDEQVRLAGLLDTEGTVRELTTELSRRIRAGELDDRTGEVLIAVRASVRSKLLVSNPDYLTT